MSLVAPITVCVLLYVYLYMICWSYLSRFWSLLEPYCSPGQPYSLPIVSSFGRGCGEMVSVDGNVVYHGHWSNISAQDLQPSFLTGMLRNSSKVIMVNILHMYV